MAEALLYEDERRDQGRDPEQSRFAGKRLFTQPYDLVITSLLDQIKDKTILLRQLSGRPKFQRGYVWPDSMASRLIESILINVPIPPCYLAQDHDYKLDVIDGQQRILSVYRFLNNELRLKDLEVLKEFNGSAFFELPANRRRKIETYTLRCVIVTNDSDPEIRFEVFERLNTNTVPLNSQELRNSISRGSLMDLLGSLAHNPLWLRVLNRKKPDKRMRDEELILRFFAFNIHGLDSYKTPQKTWLNEAAEQGRSYSQKEINDLEHLWLETIEKCLLVFKPEECFRRLPLVKRQVVNRALMDLTMYSLARVRREDVIRDSDRFRARFIEILKDDEFDDLITRAIDHKSRTLLRFDLWSKKVTAGLFE